MERLRAGAVMDPDGPDADLVIRWAAGVDALDHPDVGLVGPFPFRRTGGHTPHGFVWFSGPGFETAQLDPRPVVDLPPTILSLTARSISDDIDGTPVFGPSRSA